MLSAGSPTIPGFYGKVAAGPVPPAANALPQVRNIVQGVSSLEKPADNKLVVHQNQDKAIVDWNSFDIGANAWTHFDQQGNAGWAALNRIHDRNPSQIYGRLSADGKVLGYSSATDLDPGQVYTLVGGTEKCWTKLNEQLLAVPEGFTVNPKLKKQLEAVGAKVELK